MKISTYDLNNNLLFFHKAN